MKRLLLLGLVAVWIPGTADAYQRCQYFSDGREPRCLYQSDTGKEQYKDGRGQRPSAAASEARRRMLRHRMAVGARMQEGARHTQDMRSGGTPSVGGSTMSPFVPDRIRIGDGNLSDKSAGCVARTSAALTHDSHDSTVV